MHMLQPGVDEGTLKMLGKQASDRHCSGGVPLNTAVIDVISDRTDLSDEHVQRIVEFANNDSFTRMFKEASGPHRLISFEDGPADPAQVLQRIRGMSKEVVMKTASKYVRGMESYEAFHDEEPLAKTASGEPNLSVEMRDYSSLRSAVNHAEHQLGALRVRYESSIDGLCKEAKAAIRDGGSPADVAEALHQISPNTTFVKLALRHLSQRLQDVPAVAHTKTASHRMVHQDHPLCLAFEEMVKSAMDFYAMAGAHEKLRDTLNQVEPVMKGLLQ